MPILVQLHNGWLMMLSYMIAIAASYVVLMLLTESGMRNDRLRLFNAAIMIGIGLWAAQLVALLVYGLPFPSASCWILVGMGAIVPACGFLAAFSVIADERPNRLPLRVAGSSLVAGTSVCAMQAVDGLSGQSPVYASLEALLLAWAAAVAISYLTLWFICRLDGRDPRWRVSCSILLGIGAIVAHYIVMLGTGFPLNGEARKAAAIPSLEIVATNSIGTVVLLLLGISIVTVLVNRRLREAEQRYHSLFEFSPDLVLISDMKGRILRANRKAREVSGYEVEELVGRRWQEFACDSGKEKVSESFSKALAGQGHVMELGLIAKSGDRQDCAVSSIPMVVDGKSQGICLILRNITSDKRMKEELRLLTERHEMILNTMVEGVYGLDADKKTVFWNKAAEEMTGYASAELLGHETHDRIHPSHGNQDKPSPILTAMREGRQRHVPDDLFLRKDGSTFPVEYTVSPILTEGAEAAAAVVTFRDITELKHAREMVRRSEKLTLAGELAAGIAHEIRNPLTAIKGFIQLLKERLPSSYYDIILAEIGRIELITGELLMLSKPQVVEFRPTHIPVVLDHVATLLESEGLMRKVQIIQKYEDNLPMIRCDANQLKQVFINMLKNSIDAMPDGGTVTIEAKASRHEVAIAVRDEGVGISEDKIRKLGQPFYTTKEKGTGLGLMVSLNIIENHGGRVKVSSRLGVGTEILVYLPAISQAD